MSRQTKPLTISFRLALSFWLMLLAVGVNAATPAGTLIIGQSEAAYFDTRNGESITVLSNQSSVIVAPVYGLKLFQNQANTVAPGQTVFFIHHLQNRSNTADRYKVSSRSFSGHCHPNENCPADKLLTINGIYLYQGDLPHQNTATITETPVLQPGEEIPLIVMGTMSSLARGGDKVSLELSALSQGNSQIKDSNLDHITVSHQSALLRKKSQVFIGHAPTTRGDIHYDIRFTNNGDTPMATRLMTVDGQPEQAIFLEDPVPANTALVAPEIDAIDFSPIQAKPVVYIDSQWISYRNWQADKQKPTRIGLILPQEHFVPGQSGHLSFNVKLDHGVQKGTLVRNQAGIDLEGDGSLTFVSNETVDIIRAGEFQEGDVEALRFVEPADRITTPVFDGQYRDSKHYFKPDQISGGASVFEDIYLSLRVKNFNTSAETVDFVDVKVTSGKTGDSVWVRLRQSTANNGRFYSVSPLRLNKTTVGFGKLCTTADDIPDYQKPAPNCYLGSVAGDQLKAEVVNERTGNLYQDTADVSPNGLIFDSTTLAPVAGAVVHFYDIDDHPAKLPAHLVGRQRPVDLIQPQETKKDGRFFFPRMQEGEYYIVVDSPKDKQYRFPSVTRPEDYTGLKVKAPSFGKEGKPFFVAKPVILPHARPVEPHLIAPATHHFAQPASTFFAAKPASLPDAMPVQPRRFAPAARHFAKPAGAFHYDDRTEMESFDIPLDPLTSGDELQIEKKALQQNVKPGDNVDYEITIKNNTDGPFYNVKLKDLMPEDFAYQENTAHMETQGQNDRTSLTPDIIEQQGSQGNTRHRMTFVTNQQPQWLEIPARAILKLRYQLRAGLKKQQATNRAQATAKNSAGELLVSGERSATVNVDLPGAIVLTKEAKQKTVAPGGVVGYELTLKNNAGQDISGLAIYDDLPFGFKYGKNSLKITMDGEDIPFTLEQGRTLIIKPQKPLLADKTMTVTYVLKAGAGSIDSDGINRATVKKDGNVISNVARARVAVEMDGVLSGKAILFGKVYVDANCNNIQDEGEWPVGGVRLYMEDGTWVITDENGQYSLMGLNPGNHVIKVDPVTLPDGLELKPVDNRNAADGDSRFVDLANGEMHRADFAASCPAENYKSIVAQIKARNQSINGDWLLDDAAQYNRSKPTEKADNNGDLSNGVIRSPKQSGTDSTSDKKDHLQNQPSAAASQQPAKKSMPAAKEAVKNITREQGVKGTWLWPESQRADGRFMAVVRAGVEPVLYVNGEAVSHDRLGEQLLNNQAQSQLLAWYGVSLKDGENKVEIKATDFFGNERIMAEGVFIQSGSATNIEIKPAQDTLPADEGRSLLPVTIRVLDNNGLPASGVYFVTLETTAGHWQEPDIQDQEPGHQVRVDNGELTVHLRSGGTSGPVKLQASTGALKADTKITQIAAPRPLVAAGIIDINASYGHISGSVPALDEISDGTTTNSRAAGFIKGEIAKDTQLTLSYDSKKNKDTELFRDVDPDDYYPITGDASQKGYEAQSRSKLYAKVEKGRSSVMWGDYQTDSNGSDNDLARTQRSLTGVNGIYDNGKTRVQGFAARPEDNHHSEIIAPNGTAMHYRLERAPIVRNSEALVLETLDRKDGIVLKTKNLSRGTDYTVDEFSGYLKFTSPIHRKDEEGNLQQIRASYDIDGDGEAYTVAGGRIEHKVNDKITVGGSYTHNGHNTEGSEIGGAWVEVKPSDKTTIAVSVAAMNGEEPDKDNSDISKSYSGNASRIKVKHKWGNTAESELTWAKAQPGFRNSAGGVSEGREETRLQHKQQVGKSTTLRAEAETSRSLKDEASAQGDSIGAYIDQNIGNGWKVTAGSRYIQQRSTDDKEDYMTAEAGVEKQFKVLGKDASIKAEYEQALTNDRTRAALESNWKVHDKVSLYGRYERDENLSPGSASGDKNEFSIGLKSDWLPNTKTYTEYRMRGATDGDNLEWVNGAETRLDLVKGFSITPSVEWINTVHGDNGNDGLAISMGFQDKRYKNQRANGRIEYRHGAKQNYYGLDTAIARRLSLDWSALLREEYRLELPKADDKAKTQKHAMTIGMARRPRLNNRQHGLYLYQWKEERGQNIADNRTVHLISTHQNRQFTSDLTLSGRIGSKWVSTALENYRYDSQVWVTDARLTWDLNRRWDLDIRAGLLAVDGTDSLRWSAGVGAYYLVVRNLRVGAYYNLVGFSDKDLDSEEYNAEGIHLSLQFKFDESIFDWFAS
ncbi:hypothetical protein [Endozoicomonas sp. Mp262]|uniref:SdrD B-like domain-containing protein n=1 Tax=Endozoicomonas sp. Mp262 TaxID=2919499 RepID=UPI0021D7FE08